MAARPLLSTVTPGIALSSDPYARVAGSDEIASALITVSRRVFCRSTTGDAALTVTVSCTVPTFISIGIVSVIEPVSSMPSRWTVVKPGSVTFTAYVPGRRSTMRYWPDVSVVAERTLSMSTGLEASTVTPGRIAPDVSFTVPVIEACACARRGTSSINARRQHALPITRIEPSFGELANRSAKSDMPL